MGLYINPKNTSKEQWLLDNSTNVFLQAPNNLKMIPYNHVLVCLVNNGPFRAAAVIYSNDELKAFANPSDGREKTWHIVSLEKIKEVCPNYKSFMGDV